MNCKEKNSLDCLITIVKNGIPNEYMNILALRDKTFNNHIGDPQINEYLTMHGLVDKITDKTYFDIATDPCWSSLIKLCQKNGLAIEFLKYGEKLADVYFKDKMKKIENKKISDGKYKNQSFKDIYDNDPEYGKNIMKIFPYYKDDADWKFFFIYCSLYESYYLLTTNIETPSSEQKNKISIYNLHDKKFKDTFQNEEQYTEVINFVKERLPFVKNFENITLIELCRDITYEKICEFMISKNNNSEFLTYMKIFLDIHYPILINTDIDPKTMKVDLTSWNYRCIQYYHNLKDKSAML